VRAWLRSDRARAEADHAHGISCTAELCAAPCGGVGGEARRMCEALQAGLAIAAQPFARSRWARGALPQRNSARRWLVQLAATRDAAS